MTDKPVRASAARVLTDGRDPASGFLKIIVCGKDANGNIMPNVESIGTTRSANHILLNVTPRQVRCLQLQITSL